MNQRTQSIKAVKESSLQKKFTRSERDWPLLSIQDSRINQRTQDMRPVKELSLH